MTIQDEIYRKCTLVLCVMGLIIFQSIGQTTQVSSSENDNANVESWIDDLYTAGVSIQGDSAILSEEVKLLLTESELYTFMYPKEYTWEVTLALIEKNQIKRAFWYMINLYSTNDKNKELVVKSILTYNKFLDMEKVLTNTFYTYCFIDPQIGTLKNGQPNIIAPHLLEEKLIVVQQLVNYIQSYEQKEGNKKEKD